MNSLVKVFSNFKEFYSEINAATLTGAIDVVVVEQPDGSFQCSPFHVRFGKLGVLRSREKIVDIEINGEQVDIHMKLGESGEAFFVEECPEDDLDELPENMATSPLPTNEFAKYNEQKTFIVDPVAEGNELPIPRRNSIDLSKEFEEHKQLKLIENQISDYSTRRHTDTMERRDLSEAKKEFTTHKIRQEWACHEDQMLAAAATAGLTTSGGDSTTATQTSTSIDKNIIPKLSENQFIPITAASTSTKDDNNNNNEDNAAKKKHEINTIKRTVVNTALVNAAIANTAVVTTNTSTTTTTTITNASTMTAIPSNTNTKEESKSKKKRRKKSQMKKKSALQLQQQQQQQLNQQSQMRKNSSSSSMGSPSEQNDNETDSISISNNTANGSSNEDESPKLESIPSEGNTVVGKGTETTTESIAVTGDPALSKTSSASPTKPLITSAQRIRDLDIHFFSDTDVPSGLSPRTSRPTTPIQSDSELELSMRGEKNNENQHNNSPSWKWGELPITTTSGAMATTTASYKIAAAANTDASADSFGALTDLVDEASKQAAERNSMISNVFSFMKQSKKYRKPSKGDGGVYLSELETMEYMDPEVAALYFPPINKVNDATSMNMNIVSPPSSASQQQQLQQQQDDDRESGNGTSLPHSPSSMEGQKSLDSDYEEGKSNDRYLDFVSMSLCGGLENGGVPSDEEFQKHIVAYSEVCRNPSIFASPSLVVRLSGKYYSWAAACPIVMTILTYQKPLSNNAVEQLMSDAKNIQDISTSSTSTLATTTVTSESLTTDPVQSESKRSWWYWRRSAGGANGAAPPPGNEKSDKQLSMDETVMGEPNAVATQTSRSTTPLNESGTASTVVATGSVRMDADGSVIERNIAFGAGHDQTKDYLDIKNDLNNEVAELNDKSYDELKSMEKYRKSLRLTSEQIECLNLKNGMNEIVFSVTTAYQGTSRCKCYLFRWKFNDKVVISDIDGTITKSDVLGHILPMVGRDWAQIGVAELFTKIEENGYKLLYLSARAIGQSRATREYLRSIRQGDVALPDGPLLLNPTSLISAFHREVIEKKPEEFKIACLSDIQALFPDKNPFYAGYGNRINDVWAYRAVGIPIMRIFTINPKGELKHELTQAFQSSYCSMAFIADQLFPPINDCDESVEYSNFNYWRDPVIDIDLNLNMTSTLSTTTTTTTQQTQNSNNNNNNGGGGGGGIIQNSNIVGSSSIGNLTGKDNLGVIGGGGGGITGNSSSGGGGGNNTLSNNLPSPGQQHSSKLLPTIPEN